MRDPFRVGPPAHGFDVGLPNENVGTLGVGARAKPGSEKPVW